MRSRKVAPGYYVIRLCPQFCPLCSNLSDGEVRAETANRPSISARRSGSDHCHPRAGKEICQLLLRKQIRLPSSGVLT